MISIQQRILLDQLILVQEIDAIRCQVGDPIRKNSPTWLRAAELLTKRDADDLSDGEQDELNIAIDKLARGDE